MAFLRGVRLSQNFPWNRKIHGKSVIKSGFFGVCFLIDSFRAWIFFVSAKTAKRKRQLINRKYFEEIICLVVDYLPPAMSKTTSDKSLRVCLAYPWTVIFYP